MHCVLKRLLDPKNLLLGKPGPKENTCKLVLDLVEHEVQFQI